MRANGCVERCPACPHRDLTEAESVARKEAWLRAELAPWRALLQPLLSPASRWGYRRKTLLHARVIDGRRAFGMVRMNGREEEFIPIPDCPLHDEAVNARLAVLAGLVPADWPLAFVLVSGEAVTLVIKSVRQSDWVEALRGFAWPGSLFVNWNPVAGKRAIDSRRTEKICGQDWFTVDGLVHGPSAFRQQIPELERAALGAAEEFLAGAGVPLVVDLFCGLGASLARWEARGWTALGVELSGESLSAAAMNAARSSLLRGRVEDRIPQIEDFLAGDEFVLYTNPPRSGHGEKMLAWMLEARPRRIAYLSCHPRSLAGDLAVLGELYAVRALQPLDFFPQTSQVETLALLELR